jgi:hypothetical protein
VSLGRKVRVGIDFDSTIARIDLPWLARLNALRGASYRPEDWVDWNLSFLAEADRDVFLSLLTPDLYDVVEPYPGAAEAIHRLSIEAPVELVCVTTNPDTDSEAFTAAKTQMATKAHSATRSRAGCCSQEIWPRARRSYRRRAASLPDGRLRPGACKQALEQKRQCATPIQHLA